MVTKEQAMVAGRFHFGHCERIVGPRGGIKIRNVEFRRNGQTRTWKTRANDFRVPVKYALSVYGYIDQDNAEQFHVEADCPLAR